METTIHAIAGKGVDLPKQVVWQDLEDFITPKSEIAVGWYGKPADSTKHVYDYLIGNSVPTTLVYKEGDKAPPPIFDQHDNFTIAAVPDILVGLAQLTTPGAKAMVNGLTDIEVIEYHDRTAGVELFDIEGLVPIALTGEPSKTPICDAWEETLLNAPPPSKPAPVIVDEAAESDVPDVSGFSGEELMGLSFKVLKRIAESVAPAKTTPSDKSNAVGIILAAATESHDDDVVPLNHRLEPEIAEVVATTSAPSHEEMEAQRLGTDEAIKAFGGATEVRKTPEEAFGMALAEARRLIERFPANRKMAIIMTKLDEAKLWLEHGDNL